jgi:hypothetical protein
LLKVVIAIVYLDNITYNCIDEIINDNDMNKVIERAEAFISKNKRQNATIKAKEEPREEIKVKTNRKFNLGELGINCITK